MRKFITALCLVFLLCAIPIPAQAAKLNKAPEATKKVKILFIGNSYTQRNRMPLIFKKLCISAGKDVVVRSVTKSGHSLKSIMDPDTASGQKLMRLLTGQRWDYVVVQDRHRFPVTKPKRMRKAIASLAPYVQNAGAKMVLYQTWAPLKGHLDYYKYARLVSNRSDYQNKINSTISAIASENNALISPVGSAFLQCSSTNQGVSLIRDDYHHPTWAGSYLTACVMYATIFSDSPEGIPFTGKLNINAAFKLQEIAAFVTAGAGNDYTGGYNFPDYDYEPDDDDTPDYDYDPDIDPGISSDSTLETESEYLPEDGYSVDHWAACETSIRFSGSSSRMPNNEPLYFQETGFCLSPFVCPFLPAATR